MIAVNGGFSELAGLIGDPTRTEIVLLLMDGRAFPAGELAALVHVSAATMSHHLAILTAGGLLTVLPQGRHRYYQLATDAVAEVVELLGSLGRTPATRDNPLAEARCCYNHLAGAFGVDLRRALELSGLLHVVGDAYELTAEGGCAFLKLGFPHQLLNVRGKVCLDWTQRVPHIGGPMGTAILDLALRQCWVRRTEIPRQLVVSDIGRAVAAGFLAVT